MPAPRPRQMPRRRKSLGDRLLMVGCSPAARDLRTAARALAGVSAVAAALVFLSLTPAVQQ